MAAFKCFQVKVYDVSLPPLVVEFQEASEWTKTEEDFCDIDGISMPLYSHFVQSMDFLSKVHNVLEMEFL